jgi:hypothetical protein
MDKQLDDKFEGENLKTTEFRQDDSNDVAPKKIVNKVFGILISISIGIFAGMSCKSINESLLYSALFLGECFICICISGIVKTLSLKSSIISFAIYFFICSIVVPLASWGGSHLI